MLILIFEVGELAKMPKTRPEAMKLIESGLEIFYVLGYKAALNEHKIPLSDDTEAVAKAKYHEVRGLIEKVSKLSVAELRLLEKIDKESRLSDEEKAALK
jgi:hypothetical protein